MRGPGSLHSLSFPSSAHWLSSTSLSPSGQQAAAASGIIFSRGSVQCRKEDRKSLKDLYLALEHLSRFPHISHWLCLPLDESMENRDASLPGGRYIVPQTPKKTGWLFVGGRRWQPTQPTTHRLKAQGAEGCKFLGHKPSWEAGNICKEDSQGTRPLGIVSRTVD